MHWIPRSPVGRWSFIGPGGFVFIIIQSLIRNLLGPERTTTTLHWLFLIPGFLWMACVLAGGACASIAFFKHKDRALLLVIPAIIGLLGLLFLVGEFVFPH